MQSEQNEKYFLSRAEQYAQNPTLRNRSLLLAQKLDELKRSPENKEFREYLHHASTRIREAGRLNKKQKRALVIKALKNYVCELDELADETRLKRKDIKRILAVLHRAKLVEIRRRKHSLNPKNDYALFFVWHDLEL
jgi:hypothetical protein